MHARRGSLAVSMALATLLTTGCETTSDAPRGIRADPGAGWTSEPSPLVWEATYVESAPTLDGTLDPIWERATPLTVMVREAMGGDHPTAVVLRALYTDDSLYVAAQWPDATRSDMRDPYVWNAETNAYDRPSRPDDQFAIEFPISGDFAISMLTVTRDYFADVWHWKAGRGNPIGYVDDKSHRISQSEIARGKRHALHGGRHVYIARLGDAGTGPVRLLPPPTEFRGDVVDSFEQQTPDGSHADVRGTGAHDGTGWTLEMGRALETGNADDAAIDLSRDNRCAIAVLNDELYEEHSVSTLITLRAAPRGR